MASWHPHQPPCGFFLLRLDFRLKTAPILENLPSLERVDWSAAVSENLLNVVCVHFSLNYVRVLELFVVHLHLDVLEPDLSACDVHFDLQHRHWMISAHMNVRWWP